ncbi:hypothetical protein [Oceanobacillus alkalisoli]|uniref:hypothetical protein n=1 Tax=Oceanobacillus alkalisoli TaxID=2925113 RepID=UPI001EE43D3D|nr:hypothetical protein [Oceanobacillus alkalisoli]MCG5104977.1 hypothetical protein [Oceanobacillus alkalisoli]
MRLFDLLDDLSEQEITRIVNFAEEIKESNEKDLVEHAPVEFWDNDDKIWNEISR